MKFAVIVPTYNEEILIKQFIDHYLNHGASKIFVLDNHSTDKTCEIVSKFPEVKLSKYGGHYLGEYNMRNNMFRVKKSCVGFYNFVILVGCDEFYHPKDRSKKIIDVLKAFSGERILGGGGFDMVPGPDEKPYDPNIPLIEQRKYGIMNHKYSKSTVVKPGFDPGYSLGLHTCLPKNLPKHRPFWLLHYRSFNEEVYVTRRMNNTRRLHKHPHGNHGCGGEYRNKTVDIYKRQYKALCSKPKTKVLS